MSDIKKTPLGMGSIIAVDKVVMAITLGANTLTHGETPERNSATHWVEDILTCSQVVSST